MDHASHSIQALAVLNDAAETAQVHEKIRSNFLEFAMQYLGICEVAGEDPLLSRQKLNVYLSFVIENTKIPFLFEPYHRAVRTPIDYYDFALEMVRPLVDHERSSIGSEAIIDEIEAHLKKGENVVLLANHQSEADPQALALLLEKTHPHLAEKLTFVAGDRVTSDPMAIPFSMGCNLFCIYSKRHIEIPPEQKERKLLHNRKTMLLLGETLSHGGSFIYVAPSGGRDRKNPLGHVDVAPFDENSIELFSLLAKKATKPTHFYPLSLVTYDILPPPPSVEKELGEKRILKRGPIHARFLHEITMDNFPGSAIQDKGQRRKLRADWIHSLVKTMHDALVATAM